MISVCKYVITRLVKAWYKLKPYPKLVTTAHIHVTCTAIGNGGTLVTRLDLDIMT